MTSTWIQSQPPLSTSATSAASLPKSAERIEGAMRAVAMRRIYTMAAQVQCGMRNAFVVAFALVATPSIAATITVNATGGITQNGDCTVEEAFLAAENEAAEDACAAGTGSDTIVFDPSLASVELDVVDLPLTVTHPLIVDGAAAPGVAIA